MSWTDERVEQLKKLWLDGKSASQIAGELANGITRNAVIGKVHRLGLSGRVKAPSVSVPRPRPPRQHQHQSRPASHGGSGGGGRGGGHGGHMTHGANALAYSPQIDAEPLQRPMEQVVIPMSQRVTIMELKEAMCRWPLGDPGSSEFRYCGADSPSGGSYCQFHAQVAYQPAQDRRRDRDRERRALARQG